MKISRDQVKHIAKLANLPLTSEEEEKYSEQLSKILDFVEQLNKVETEGVEPTFNVSGQENVMQEDLVGDCTLTSEEALANAPKKNETLPAGRQEFFVTKGVFDNE